MKKKKIIITSLILTMAMTNINPSLAAKIDTEKTQIKENMEEKVKETYVINEIGEESVLLNKKGMDSDLVSVPKEEFKDIDLKVGKEVNITSDGINLLSEPGQFSKIYEIEEVGDSSKKEKVTGQFIIKEINKEAVTVEKEGSEGELYTLSKKYFTEELSLEDRYEISHNDIVMNSYPAQFNKVYEVKKLDNDNEKTNEANNKKNDMDQGKANEESTKVSKNPKTGISPALISLSALSLSLAGLKISKKK